MQVYFNSWMLFDFRSSWYCDTDERKRVNENVFKYTYNNVLIGIYLSDWFPIQNGLKQGDALSPLLFNCALEYAG